MDAIEMQAGQGARAIPFVSGASGPDGHYAEFCVTPLEFMARAYAECGELAEFDMAGLRTVLMVGPQAHEAFFRAPEDQLNAAAAYQMMVPVFGEGVQFGAPPDIERQQLRIQFTGLRHDRMLNYAGLVAGEVQAFIADWGDEGEKDFYHAFTDLTLKTSTHCLLGTELRYLLTEEFEELYGALDRGLDPAALRDPYQQKETYRQRDLARIRLQEIVSAAVRSRRERGIVENDMLQVYMDAKYEDGSSLTENEITGMVIWFMFAGHHTSSNTAAWTLVEMAKNPQYFPELKAEIDAVYAKQSELSMHALREIPLLEGFVRESLRVHPPLNVLSRRVLKEFTYKDYTVGVGKNVMLCPHVAHKLEEYFPNPEVFDPKRVPPENVFAAISFGGGKHKCIGNAFALLQVRAIFCALLREYDFELAQPADAYKEVMPTLILRPSDPCRLRYKRRKH